MKRLAIVLFAAAIATNALAVRVSRELVLSGPVVSSPERPAAVWTGAHFATFWVQGGDVRAARISPDGRLLEPSRVVWAGVSRPVEVARDSDSIAVITSVATHGLYATVLVRRFSFDLEPLTDPILLGMGAAPQIEFDGVAWIVSWLDLTGDPIRYGALLMARFDRSFNLLTQRMLSPSPVSRIIRWSMATNGVDWLLVWDEPIGCDQPTMDLCVSLERIRAARINADLAPIDPSGFTLATDGYEPSVEWVGDHYVALWTSLSQVVAARIDPSGSILGQPLPLIGEVSRTSVLHPAEGSTGNEILAAGSLFDYSTKQSGILAAHASADGALIDEPFWIASGLPSSVRLVAGPPGIFLVTYGRYFDTQSSRYFFTVIDLHGTPIPRGRASRR